MRLLDVNDIVAELSLSAQSQDRQEFGGTLQHAGPAEPWFAFRRHGEFKDDYVRIVALNDIAWWLTRLMSDGPDEVAAQEAQRTERVSEVPQPIAWLKRGLSIVGQPNSLFEDGPRRRH